MTASHVRRSRAVGPILRLDGRWVVLILAILVAASGVESLPAQAPLGAARLQAVPQLDWGYRMLPIRKIRQEQTVDQFRVFYQFQFTDRQSQSGLDFNNVITPDSAKYYQPNHYDHGNGVVVADIDGDRLHDIYFVSQLGRNALFRNLGGGRFEDVTDRAGVALEDRVGASAAFADIDNDGDPDLFVTTIRTGNVLFRNQGDGHFEDVTAAAGLGYAGHSSAGTFADFDNDGLLDLFLANVGVFTSDTRTPDGHFAGIPPDSVQEAFSGHLLPERTEYSILYRNLGDGRFEDVSQAVGLQDGGWTGDASFADLNQDGFQDIYVLNMQGDDHYYENVGGKSFVDRTKELFPKTPWGSMGIKFFDYNNDGLQDLILTDMHSDMSRGITPGFEKMKSAMVWDDEFLQGADDNIFGNAFYENQGRGVWVERSDELGTENYWPWGLTVADINADGFDDVLITSSMNFPFPYGINSVLLNNQGERFLDSEFLLGVEPRSGLLSRPWYTINTPQSTMKPWFQLSCSGQDARHQLCQGKTGNVTILGNVGSRSAVIFDLDRDGDLDIVTNEFHDLPQVLISNLDSARQIHYLEVELVGSTSNRDALGAVVQLTAGGRTYTKVNDGKSGYLSQSSKPLYFGLGDTPSIDKITVRWPSGREQQLTEPLPTNDLLVIEED